MTSFGNDQLYNPFCDLLELEKSGLFFFVKLQCFTVYSEDIYTFLANFIKRIVKKGGQKLISGNNFINKNNDDFYVLQHCFYDIFYWTIKNSQKLRKTAKMVVFRNFWLFLMVQSKNVIKPKLQYLKIVTILAYKVIP